MHRPQHFVGHIGGPGNRQKLPARANDHCCSSFFDPKPRSWMQGKAAKFNPALRYFPIALVTAAQI
jgi:hypothetical protein